MMSSVTNSLNKSSSEPPANSTPSQQDVLWTHQRRRTSPRMSFFDEEYTGGRRVPSPILQPTVSPPATASESSSKLGGVSPEECLALQARIQSLFNQQYVPEFKEHLIPSLESAPDYHHRLQELVQRRN